MAKMIGPSAAQRLAAVVSGNGRSRVIGAARPVLCRLPEWQLAEVDAMAKGAGQSRNSMITELLAVGIEGVRAEMTNDDLVDLNAETSKRMAAFQEATADRTSIEEV